MLQKQKQMLTEDQTVETLKWAKQDIWNLATASFFLSLPSWWVPLEVLFSGKSSFIFTRSPRGLLLENMESWLTADDTQSYRHAFKMERWNLFKANSDHMCKVQVSKVCSGFNNYTLAPNCSASVTFRLCCRNSKLRKQLLQWAGRLFFHNMIWLVIFYPFLASLALWPVFPALQEWMTRCFDSSYDWQSSFAPLISYFQSGEKSFIT